MPTGLGIADNVPASPGSLPWRAPATGPSGLEPLGGLRIWVESTEDVSVFGEGPEFTLITPTITVTSPRGGERIPYGETRRVEWSCPGLHGSVRIELVHPDGRVTFIDRVGARDGSHPWVVGMFHDAPAATGEGFKIRVVSEYSDAIFGESAGSFSIVR